MSGVSALSRAVMRHPARAWGSYMQKLNRNPITTKMATSVAAAMLGDALAQRLSRPADGTAHSYDLPRTLRLCGFNAAMGCLGHFYYGALDRRVMVHAPKTFRAVTTKVAIDQLMFAPVCTAIFYAYKVCTEGRPRDLGSELQEKWLPTLKAGWMLWPAAHVLNFSLVPTQHRILYANVVSVAGTYLLSRAAAGDFSSSPKSSTRDGATEVVCDGVIVKTE